MARPIEIDRARAQRAAKALFWRRGYSAASMNQLLDAMDMGRGSFYAAFGSKAELFETVVDDYAARSVSQFADVRRRHRGLAAIRAFLDRTLVNISAANRRRGCLLVNSVLELAEVEHALHGRVSRYVGDLEATLHECLVEAQQDGELRNDLSPSEAASLLLSLFEGLRVESRRGLTRGQARQRVATLLALIARPGGNGFRADQDLPNAATGRGKGGRNRAGHGTSTGGAAGKSLCRQ